MSSLQWYYKPWVWGFLGGVATNVLINGGHIQCCHTVQSVALGSVKLGLMSALAAGALGYMVTKVAGPFGAGKRTTMNLLINVMGAASVGLLGVVSVLKLDAWYFQYCMRQRRRNIDLTKIQPIPSS